MSPFLNTFITKNFTQPGKALDLGCGTGKDMHALQKQGWQCDGVDILTGTDLNELYHSKNAPYDLVYSNYVLQQLKNPAALVRTIEDNLKMNGHFFIHTFDESDQTARTAFTRDSITKLIQQNSKLHIQDIQVLHVFDDEPGHNHYHEILQVSGTKS